MIILDTNVLSALMRNEPDPVAVAWLDGLASESIWLTSITVFEARMGLALSPEGKRREGLRLRFEELIELDLQGRILDFDADAAAEAAGLAARRQRGGRPVDMRDIFIAGIAQARGAAIATRNARHFEGLSVAVIDPWSPS